MKNKVSIIIPVYNTKDELLKKCLDSVLGQTYKNIEVLLIDDGSNAKCEKVYKEIINNDSRVKIIKQKNSGVSTARNNGIENATGEWISFVDSDDWISENFCEVFINEIEKDKTIDIFFCKSYLCRKENVTISKVEYKKNKLISSKQEKLEVLESILYGSNKKYSYVNTPWAKIYRKKFLEEQKIRYKENLKIAEDGLFNYTAFSKCKKAKFVNEILYYYNIYDGSSYHRYNPSMPQNFINVFNYYEEMFAKNDVIYLKDAYYYYVFRMLIDIIKKSYFHPDNKKSFLLKSKELKEMLKRNIYIKCFKNVKLDQLNKKRKIIYMLLKYRLILLCYICFNHGNKKYTL